MMFKANERHNTVANEALHIRLTDRYTSLVSRDVSLCIPDNSRIATFDELLREYNKETDFRDRLESYCSRKNTYDGWVLVSKGRGYCPENIYWHYQIDKGAVEHVRRAMLRKIPEDRRVAVFMKNSSYLCVKFGAGDFPPGNELYIARAAYVMLDTDDEKYAFEREKR